MRRILIAALLLSISAASLASMGAASPARGAQSPPLRLVSTAWPPFTNDSSPRFALDLVEAALGRIGMNAKTTIVEPARFTPLLLSSEYDGSGAAWKDGEREAVLVFSQPYLENRLILVARRGADVSAASLEALKGKRVAVVLGYAYGDALEKSGADLVRSSSEEDSLTLLLAGKTEYALMDELVVQFIVDNYPAESRTKLSLGTTPLLTRPLHFAIRRSRPDAESIVSRFNAQLRTMISDRTYHRLLHVSWIRADVDGDGIPELVPRSDQFGTKAPDRAYTILSTGQPTPKTIEVQPRFYIGGSIYTDWASVPNRYKVEDPKRPDPSRSTASIFRFTW